MGILYSENSTPHYQYSEAVLCQTVPPKASARKTNDENMICVQTLWHALKPGGAYIVEDISENYIEKPFGEFKSSPEGLAPFGAACLASPRYAI